MPKPRQFRLEASRPLVLRAAEPQDARALLSLESAVAAEGSGFIAVPEEVQARAERLAALLGAWAAHPDRLWLLACDGQGRVLGFLRCRGYTPLRTRHRATVTLAVRRSARGRGVGRALLEGAVQWAGAHPGIERLELWVLASNRAARRLYRGAGFARSGRRPQAVKDPVTGAYTDDIFMSRRVKPAGAESAAR